MRCAAIKWVAEGGGGGKSVLEDSDDFKLTSLATVTEEEEGSPLSCSISH